MTAAVPPSLEVVMKMWSDDPDTARIGVIDDDVLRQLLEVVEELHTGPTRTSAEQRAALAMLADIEAARLRGHVLEAEELVAAVMWMADELLREVSRRWRRSR